MGLRAWSIMTLKIALLLLLPVALLPCVNGGPVTRAPCRLPGPWDSTGGIRCLPGCFLQEDKAGEGGSCSPCQPGSYLEHVNTEHSCLRCRSCDTAAGFEEQSACSTVQNAQCRCRAGLQCVDSECHLCMSLPRCPPGEEPAGATHCAPCHPGFYSGTLGVERCKEHTRCEHLEMTTLTNGTQEADAVCSTWSKMRADTISVTVGVILVVVVVVLFLCVLCNGAGRRIVAGWCCRVGGHYSSSGNDVDNKTPLTGESSNCLPSMAGEEGRTVSERGETVSTAPVYNITAKNVQVGVQNTLSMASDVMDPAQLHYHRVASEASDLQKEACGHVNDVT